MMRRQTWYYLALLGLSLVTLALGVNHSLPAASEPLFWSYRLDHTHSIISGCSNSSSAFSRELLKARTQADRELSKVVWKQGQLFNAGHENIDHCFLKSLQNDSFQIQCFQIPAESLATSVEEIQLFSTREDCWQNRDLDFFKRAQSFHESQSLEGFKRQLTRVFR